MLPVGVQVVQEASSLDFSRWRSFRFARRIAGTMIGATNLGNPLGSPRFRNVILVALPSG